MRKLLLALACVALASCSTLGGLATNHPVDVAGEKLAMTDADEIIFDTLTGAVTVAADSADFLGVSGVVKPGSPEALKIAELLDTTRDAINHAYAVWRGTVTGDRAEAMKAVATAFTALSAELAKWRKP